MLASFAFKSTDFGFLLDFLHYGRFTGLFWLELATVIYSEETLQTQGSQQQIDCLVRQEKIPDEYIIEISDKWTEKQPNLAFNQKGQINSRQLWLRFEGQMGYSISFEVPSWRIRFFWS